MPARQRKKNVNQPNKTDSHSDSGSGKAVDPQNKNHEKQDLKENKFNSSSTTPVSKAKQLFGFELSDFSSIENFVQLCNKPTNASCLATFRIVFGVLMVFDCMHERGLTSVVSKWSDEFELCRFPLFDFLQPLPVEWMAILYLLMGAGAIGIALGLFYRVSCLMFVIPYWYMFLLDKRSWNNHSYLFGLIATLLLFCDANRCWSLDSKRNPSKCNDIPAWQYGLFRFQLVTVYFVAGLKKLDNDWVQGYSMQSLSYQWVFDPFRHFMTNEQIDRYIVHWGGLMMDLTAGFLLFFDATRWLGTASVISFNAMNSRMFRIGQFPYVMLASVILFYPYDWPKKVFPSGWFSTESTRKSKHCLYTKDKAGLYHKFFAVFTVSFMVWQAIMPYSHFITQGYNNWTGGLYGYSWDMMIHNWHTQHIKVKYVSKDTGEEGYIDPKAFVSINRWPGYPDMIKQHALCIARHLDVDYGLPNVEVYMDIWQSMNQRFQQR